MEEGKEGDDDEPHELEDDDGRERIVLVPFHDHPPDEGGDGRTQDAYDDENEPIHG